MNRLPLLLLVVLGAMLAACSSPEAPQQQVSIVELHPVDRATDVPVDVHVTAKFDGALDSAALLDAVAMSLSDASVAGELNYDPDDFALVFTPAADLAPATTYVVTLAGTVKALQGAAIGEDTVWSFTTAAPAGDDGGSSGGEEPGSGGEDPVDTDGDGIPDAEDPDIDGDGILNEDDYDPYDPDVDDDGVVDGDLVGTLDGVLSIDPAPGTTTTNRTSLTITLDRAIDPTTLELDTTVVVYGLVPGNHIVNGVGTDEEPFHGVLTYDEATHALTFTFDAPLPQTPPKFWVFLELDVVDADGDPLQLSARWLYKVDPEA